MAPSIGVMVPFRFVLGLAVGGASSTVPVFFAELAPAELRGQMVTWNEFMIVFGQLVAFVINAILGTIWSGESVGFLTNLILFKFILYLFIDKNRNSAQKPKNIFNS